MKKFLIVCFMFVTLCSGCSFINKNNGNGKQNEEAPITLINTSVSEEIEDLSALYEICKKSVVTVLNYASYYDKGKVVTSLYGSGSGFVYSASNDYIYLYTNAHVVSVNTGYNQSYYEVVFHDGVRSYASLLYKDGSEDVAVMKIERESQDFAIASIGNSDDVKPGQSIFTLGSPLGLEYANTITRGIVSNVKVQMETDDDSDGEETTMYMIQIDASLNPGNSGGPLFNSKGEVIGVNTLKLMTNSSGDDVETFNFCIPVNHFVIVANSLINNGIYSRPKLGITILDVTSVPLKEREKLDISVSKGIYIEQVVSDSASQGILESKTIITKINNVNVTNMADFSCELYKYLAGDKISVTTTDLNGNNTTTHQITLR